MAGIPGTPPQGQLGFSLLEVLIALLIAGLALGTLFRAATESVHGTAIAARYQEAAARARSRLDTVGTSPVMGEQSGDDGGGFQWRSLAHAIGSTGTQDEAADTAVVSLYAVTVWISWRDGPNARTLRLDSERLLTSRPMSARADMARQ